MNKQTISLLLFTLISSFSSEGVTTENVVDFAVDAAFEVLPAQAEKAIENTGLDNVSKRILQAEIKQVSKTAEIITNKTIEHNREKNDQ
ncbi:MAG: hypothetical protein NXI00_08640 [Cytophagales bacterium]|nr:hypothetical protein [Cytophagales bacterium]